MYMLYTQRAYIYICAYKCNDPGASFLGSGQMRLSMSDNFRVLPKLAPDPKKLALGQCWSSLMNHSRSFS